MTKSTCCPGGVEGRGGTVLGTYDGPAAGAPIAWGMHEFNVYLRVEGFWLEFLVVEVGFMNSLELNLK